MAKKKKAAKKKLATDKSLLPQFDSKAQVGSSIATGASRQGSQTTHHLTLSLTRGPGWARERTYKSGFVPTHGAFALQGRVADRVAGRGGISDPGRQRGTTLKAKRKRRSGLSRLIGGWADFPGSAAISAENANSPSVDALLGR